MGSETADEVEKAADAPIETEVSLSGRGQPGAKHLRRHCIIGLSTNAAILYDVEASTRRAELLARRGDRHEGIEEEQAIFLRRQRKDPVVRKNELGDILDKFLFGVFSEEEEGNMAEYDSTKPGIDNAG